MTKEEAQEILDGGWRYRGKVSLYRMAMTIISLYKKVETLEEDLIAETELVYQNKEYADYWMEVYYDMLSGL
jgi:hypothetical protein